MPHLSKHTRPMAVLLLVHQPSVSAASVRKVGTAPLEGYGINEGKRASRHPTPTPSPIAHPSLLAANPAASQLIQTSASRDAPRRWRPTEASDHRVHPTIHRPLSTFTSLRAGAQTGGDIQRHPNVGAARNGGWDIRAHRGDDRGRSHRGEKGLRGRLHAVAVAVLS